MTECKCGHPLTHHAPRAFGRRCERATCECVAYEHPAHSGHEYGGGYARAAALAAGDPEWTTATGGTERGNSRTEGSK